MRRAVGKENLGKTEKAKSGFKVYKGSLGSRRVGKGKTRSDSYLCEETGEEEWTSIPEKRKEGWGINGVNFSRNLYRLQKGESISGLKNTSET